VDSPDSVDFDGSGWWDWSGPGMGYGFEFWGGEGGWVGGAGPGLVAETHTCCVDSFFGLWVDLI
jgi:hypothetical protein